MAETKSIITDHRINAYGLDAPPLLFPLIPYGRPHVLVGNCPKCPSVESWTFKP